MYERHEATKQMTPLGSLSHPRNPHVPGAVSTGGVLKLKPAGIEKTFSQVSAVEVHDENHEVKA